MKNDYFEEITSTKWGELINQKSIPLNIHEVDNLKKIFPNCTIFYTIRLADNNKYSYCSVEPPYKTHEINVTLDEWYLVSVVKPSVKFYICDQWDGLIELLKDIGDIK